MLRSVQFADHMLMRKRITVPRVVTTSVFTAVLDWFRQTRNCSVLISSVITTESWFATSATPRTNAMKHRPFMPSPKTATGQVG